MKNILTYLSSLVFLSALLFSGFIFLSQVSNLPLPKIFLVSSGSMEPAIKTGSLVFTQPRSVYLVGDIITFKSDSKSKTTTTHRIVAQGGGVVKTIGDANQSPDSKLIPVSQILGKVIYTLPYIGYLAGFIQTPQGFILFVIVPATILVYEELKGLFLEIKNKLKSPKTVSSDVYKTVWLAVIPVLFAGLVVTTRSNSFFHDTEISSQNTITAWITEPTPTPSLANHIVISEIQIKGQNALQDFVELYNPTNTPVDLSGWKLRYCATNRDEVSLAVIPAGKTLPAYGFFLWANNSSGFASSIGADISNTNNLGENYSVGLRKPDNTLVDQVGWGISNCPLSEGTRYPDINNDVKSIERKAYWNSTSADMIVGGSHESKGNGFDNHDNATDFISRPTGSNPQNSLSPTETP